MVGLFPSGPFETHDNITYLLAVVVPGTTSPVESTTTKTPEVAYDQSKMFTKVKWNQLNKKEIACAERQLGEALEAYKDNEEVRILLSVLKLGPANVLISSSELQYVKIIKGMQAELAQAKRELGDAAE